MVKGFFLNTLGLAKKLLETWGRLSQLQARSDGKSRHLMAKDPKESNCNC
jgi:hypothetical protein